MRLLLLLAAAAASLAVTAGTRYNAASTCQKSYPCGANVNIHYPFFLPDATTAIDGYAAALSYCGYPGMAVACENGRATLKLRDRDYTVLEINYDNHTVTVADADVLGGAGGCPRVTHNVTVPAETWLNLSTTANENLVFFFDCAFTVAVQRPPTLPPPINCTGFPGRDGESFVAAEPDVRPRDDLPQSCKAVVATPVLKYWLLDKDYSRRLNDDGYGKVLKQGFQLTWDPSAGPCFICEDSGGQCSYSQTGQFVGCLCPDGRVRDPGCGGIKSKAGIIVSGSVITALLSLALSMWAYRKKFRSALPLKFCRGSQRTPRIESFLQKHEAQHPKRFTYSEVKRMTKSFTHKLGQGGFGTVYKGNLPNGRQIAVKLLKNSKDNGLEFMNEVASIMRTSHVNVVALLGYCLQGSKRALIYEYMPNGSLERFTFGQNPEGENSLSWDKLFDIIVGIARGLEYLHRGCSTRIVHFDIKPHNFCWTKIFVQRSLILDLQSCA